MLLLITRQCFLIILFIYILPRFFYLNGVWMAQPLSNVPSFFIVVFWAKRELRLLNE